MVLSSQRTIHWLSILLDMSVGKVFNILPNTSLNEKFNIDTDIHTPEGNYPKLNYFAIGVGGEVITDATTSYRYSRHSVIDGALFNQIPFALKLPEEDFTSEVQAKYRFRKTVYINNTEYIAYYLKLCGDVELRDFYYEINTIDGKSTLGVYNNNTDKILNPTPINKSTILNNLNTTNYISKLIKFFFTLTATEMYEIFNVIEILNLDATHITEIGICSGHDMDVDGELKAIDTQMAYIMDTNLFLATDMLSEDTINLWLEVGGSEPLMV